MIAATLALALGATLLGAFRLSGSPPGGGVLVFVGTWFIAIGCAMQLAAIVDGVAIGAGWRVAAKGVAWAATLTATAWAIGRAPGPQLLAGVLIVPPLVGLAGLGLPGRDRGPALGFALVAFALSALLMPAALERLSLGTAAAAHPFWSRAAGRPLPLRAAEVPRAIGTGVPWSGSLRRRRV